MSFIPLMALMHYILEIFHKKETPEESSVLSPNLLRIFPTDKLCITFFFLSDAGGRSAIWIN